MKAKTVLYPFASAVALGLLIGVLSLNNNLVPDMVASFSTKARACYYLALLFAGLGLFGHLRYHRKFSKKKQRISFLHTFFVLALLFCFSLLGLFQGNLAISKIPSFVFALLYIADAASAFAVSFFLSKP